MTGRRREVLPLPAVRAVLDAGCTWYPVHDEQRAANRARLAEELRARAERAVRLAQAHRGRS